ncbi:laminin subunit alpha-4-like [Clupea harengus]|uniref:Laminin subunit alpha-4-like n=1 Tax=Clupea harengus TaxID=7950 RepID=A0A8M1KVK6_CLUHA|nr:laminin subunit alpha-4-like [Clupea harengus]
MKTTSTEGLIVHIRGKQNGAHVTLYMTSGKIRLMVGNRSIHYHKKINDNHWHKVDLSVEKHSFHLLVDNLRVTDGQLPAGEGAALSLSSPVYLGADLTTPNTEAQVPLSLPVYLGADLTSPKTEAQKHRYILTLMYTWV